MRDTYSTEMAAMEERHGLEMEKLRTEVLADERVRGAEDRAEDAAEDAARAADEAAESAVDDAEADELEGEDGAESMDPPPAPIPAKPHVPAAKEKRGWMSNYR